MGVLANCEVNVVQLIDHGDYSNYQSELKYLLTNEKRLDYLANLFNTIGESGNTMVLVDRVESGKALARRLGDQAVFISGATKAGDRKEHYDEVADVDNVTTGVLSFSRIVIVTDCDPLSVASAPDIVEIEIIAVSFPS